MTADSRRQTADGSAYVLGIETSTPVCSVGLVDQDRVVVSYAQSTGLQHAERLMLMVERVLSDAGLMPADLQGVAVGAGPGSFTGLRIGMGAAKGLCLALELPLLCVPTLEGLAAQVVFGGLPVCAMLDARRGQVYAGVYDLEAGSLTAVVPDRVLPVEDVLQALPQPILFVGQGARVHRDRLVQVLGEEARFAPEAISGGASVALLGVQRLRAGLVADLATAEPLYLRQSQAEQAREARLQAVVGEKQDVD